MPPQHFSAARLAKALALLVGGLLLALMTPRSAMAADEADLDGARIKLRVIQENDAVRAALEIDLKPGWKTYWISPGAAGLAPRIALDRSEGLHAVTIAYPVPSRFREGDVDSVGYEAPVGFTISAETMPGALPVMRADILIGLCKEICLPAQVQLDAAPSTSLSARAAVRRAFDALPAIRPAAWAGWRARFSEDERALLLDHPTNETQTLRDIFVAAPDGWAFGPPVLERSTSEAPLQIPILSAPTTGPSLERIDLVLTDGEKADLIRALPVGRD